MTHYISEQALPPLWLTREENERLEKKNAQLKKDIAKLEAENSRLRGIKLQERRSALFQAPGASGSNTSPGRFAQQTESSRRKTKDSAQDDMESGKQTLDRQYSDDVNVISGAKYIYSNGVPIRVRNAPPTNEWGVPQYMKATRASISREQAILSTYYGDYDETESEKWYPRWNGRNEAENHEADQPAPWVDDLNPDLLSTSPDVPDAATQSLANQTRLDDNLRKHFETPTYIDCATNFNYLEQARKLVQKAIYDASEQDAFNWKGKFPGGPDFVTLGRNEILEWTRGRVVGAYKNVTESQIWPELMQIVTLRNAISHAHACELVYGRTVDNLLSDAQSLTVVLGDEERSMAIRQLRDNVLAAARESKRELLDTVALRCLPFQGDVEFKYHQIRQLKEAERWERSRQCDPEILTAAREWTALLKE